eukprot:gene1771-14111_t
MLMGFGFASVAGRPTDFDEASTSYMHRFVTGMSVGLGDIITFTGVFAKEEDKVRDNADVDFYRQWYDEALNKGMHTKLLDAQPKSKQSTIQVVGLGLGRTGSTSVALALGKLGFLSIHDDEQPDLAEEFWAEEVGAITKDQLHQLFGMYGYNASFKTDYHWVAKHPEVKAILTVRDSPDKYVDSWLKAAPFVDLMQQRPYTWMPSSRALVQSFEEEYKGETTGGHPENYLHRETLKNNYVRYIEEVKAAIPAQRLLILNVKDGWGKPIPDGSFPHVHDRVKLEGEMFVVRGLTWIWPAVLIYIPVFTLLTFKKCRSFLTPQRGLSLSHGSAWSMVDKVYAVLVGITLAIVKRITLSITKLRSSY